MKKKREWIVPVQLSEKASVRTSVRAGGRKMREIYLFCEWFYGRLVFFFVFFLSCKMWFYTKAETTMTTTRYTISKKIQFIYNFVCARFCIVIVIHLMRVYGHIKSFSPALTRAHSFPKSQFCIAAKTFKSPPWFIV